MKKFTFVFAGLLMAFQSYAANDLIEIKTVKDFQNRRGVSAQPEGVFAISRASWVVAKKYIDVTPDTEYKVSCFIRSASDAKLRIRLGLSVLGADKNPVFFSGVNPVKNTEAVLVAPVEAAQNFIIVKDASKWLPKLPSRIVYDADPSGQLRDIPNNSYLGNRVISIVPHEGNFKITFSGKAGIELPAGHVVRQHADGRRAILGPQISISGEWKKYEFIIVKGISPDARVTNKLFPGVAKISPLLVVPGAVNIKEFKLEKIK